MCIVDRSGHTTMVAIDMEETTVKAHAAFDDIRVYREFTDDPMREVAAALEARGLAEARVGVEMEYLPAGDFATLRGHCCPRPTSWRRTASSASSARSRPRVRSTSSAP